MTSQDNVILSHLQMFKDCQYHHSNIIFQTSLSQKILFLTERFTVSALNCKKSLDDIRPMSLIRPVRNAFYLFNFMCVTQSHPLFISAQSHSKRRKILPPPDLIYLSYKFTSHERDLGP